MKFFKEILFAAALLYTLPTSTAFNITLDSEITNPTYKLSDDCKAGYYLNTAQGRCVRCLSESNFCDQTEKCCACPNCECRAGGCSRRCTDDKQCRKGLSVCQEFTDGKYCIGRCTRTGCRYKALNGTLCDATGHCITPSTTGRPSGKDIANRQKRGFCSEGYYWNVTAQRCNRCSGGIYTESRHCDDKDPCCYTKEQTCPSGQFLYGSGCRECSAYMGQCKRIEECCLCPECECHDKRCTKRCTNDKQCGTLHVCQESKKGKYCAERCTQPRCTNMLGFGSFCASNGHCTRCSQTGGPCGKKDTDCCYGYHECINNTCQVKPMNCTKQINCDDGQACIDGRCKACEADSECASAQLFCKDSKCTKCRREGNRCSRKGECCACAGCNCVGGMCTAKKECKKDSDCPRAQICEAFGTTRVCKNRCSVGSCGYNEYSKGFCGSDGRCRKCVRTWGTCDSSVDRCCFSTDSCQHGLCLQKMEKKCNLPGDRCDVFGDCCGEKGCESNGGYFECV